MDILVLLFLLLIGLAVLVLGGLLKLLFIPLQILVKVLLIPFHIVSHIVGALISSCAGAGCLGLLILFAVGGAFLGAVF